MSHVSSSPAQRVAVRRWRYLVCAVCVTLVGLSSGPWVHASGNVLQMVKEINPATDATFGSNPRLFTRSGDTTYFMATDAFNGRTLWKTDGTADGTTNVLNNRYVGDEYQPDPFQSDTIELVDVQGTLFYSTYSSIVKTDGTAAGTTLVRSFEYIVNDVHMYSTPSRLMVVGNLLFFVVQRSDTNVRSLWRTDGTAGGTIELKEIGDNFFSVGYKGFLYFRHAGQLWKSDGTAAGTVVFHAGKTTGSYSIGNRLYFTTNDNTLMDTLWSSDGTAEGTLALGEVREFFWPTLVNTTVYFANSGELWKTDGTPSGTGQVSRERYQPRYLANLNGVLYFIASANQIWKSDGTPEGTMLVRGVGQNILDVAMAGTKLYVTANRQADSGSNWVNDLWVSDGTAAGTVLLRGGWTSELGAMADVEGALFFGAEASGTGYELWRSDGTPAGTRLFKDIFVTRKDANIREMTALGERVLFRAADERGAELWASDGTAAGTQQVKDIVPGAESGYPDDLTPGKTIVFFTASGPGVGTELWRSDGTANGTVQVKDIRPGPESIELDEYIAENDTLHFSANDGTHGVELWISDGTSGGTRLVKDINPGTANAYPRRLTVSGDWLYFTASDGEHGFELWKSDGTAAGTTMVMDKTPGSDGGNIAILGDVGGVLLFLGSGTGDNWALWRTDGTSAGTRMIKDVMPNTVDLFEYGRVVSGKTLYFSMDPDASGKSYFWRSDGTVEGTRIVKDVPVDNLTALNGVLYFIGPNRELWKSDGTDAGTVVVRPSSGTPPILNQSSSAIVPVPDRGIVLFDAYESVSKPYSELWQSDGTAAGTHRVADPLPGAAGTPPESITAAGSRIFFTAADAVHGRELWTIAPRPAADYTKHVYLPIVLR